MLDREVGMIYASSDSMAVAQAAYVGAFMADLAGRRSVLFPKIQREAGET